MSGQLPDEEDRILEAAGKCARDLDGLGRGFLDSFHSCERDFLRLGEALHGFNATASDVARRCAELAELTSGEAVSAATANLGSQLERMVTTCDEDCMGREVAGLETIASVGSKLSENMRDFTRLVKHLSMLGISTRIESARLGSQGLGFSTLADDVEKLAGKIESSSERISSRAVELSKQCHEASKSIVEMKSAREGYSRSAMELLEADLAALDRLRESSNRIAAGISGEAESLVASVSEAVLSMQFHDIIRQQLEHVSEAAAEVKSMAEAGPRTAGGHDARDWEELGGWMQSVLTLQHSQLDNAHGRFSQAMESLGSSLHDIAGRVATMAAQAGGLSSGDSGQRGVLGQIEQEISGIAQSLKDYAALETRMSVVMGEVGGSIREMASSVSEIEEVGSEIELIALNASVRAAHTGEEGKALGVLASAIQKLSVDARSQTDKISQLLASVDAGSLDVEAIAGASVDARTFEASIAELDTEMARLKALDTHVAQAALAVQKEASGLSSDIKRTVDSMGFQRGLLSAMTTAEDKLKGIAGNLGAVLPADLVVTHSPQLREMLERYTMDAERLVHQDVLGIEPGEGASQGSGDYGDNVELF
jgi:methyl-accepting chemotaxis protein